MLLLEYYYYYYYFFWSCSCSNLCFCTCVRIGMLIGRINHKRTRAHVYCNVVVQCVYGENGDPARSRPCDWFDIVSLLAIPPRRPPAGGERRRIQLNDTAHTADDVGLTLYHKRSRDDCLLRVCAGDVGWFEW